LEALAKQGCVSVCVCLVVCYSTFVNVSVSECGGRIIMSCPRVVKLCFSLLCYVIGGLIHIKIPVVLFDDRAATDQQDQQARKSSRQLVPGSLPGTSSLGIYRYHRTSTQKGKTEFLLLSPVFKYDDLAVIQYILCGCLVIRTMRRTNKWLKNKARGRGTGTSTRYVHDTGKGGKNRIGTT